MKNILHISESSETGGAETVFIDMVTNLDATSYHSTVALFEHGWLEDQLVKYELKPVVLGTQGAFDIKLLFRIRKLVKENDIDLIHAHLFGASVYASIVARICNVPVVCTIHGTMDVGENERLRRLKYWFVNTFSTKIVFVSKYLLKYFNNQGLGVKQGSSVVVYNGIDTGKYNNFPDSQIRSEFNYTEGNIVIGAVGDIRHAKGYEYLLRAVAKLRSVVPEARFLIAGSETPLLTNLKDLCDNLGVSDIVNFIGHRQDVPDILNAIDVYILPSISEGFSLTTIEAMSASKPVIATRSGGPEEIITDGVDGRLIAIENEDEIVSCVVDILKNPDKRSILSLNARKTVLKKFSVKMMVAHYSDLYNNIIDNNR